MALADDLPRLWNHPAASTETRKRILRAVLKEVIVTVEPDACASCCTGRVASLKDRHGDRARDQRIVSVLNRLGIRSAKGHTRTELRVRNSRCEHGSALQAAARPGSSERCSAY
jgi:hypothetical protein